MLIDSDKIDPYSRQLLWVFLQAAERSPELTVSQKTKIESLCQQIVNEWTKKDESKKTYIEHESNEAFKLS